MASPDAAACAESYNRGIRALSQIVLRAAPDDPLIQRSHRQVGLLLGLLPFAAINITGKYLLKYQEQVYRLEKGTEADDEFFLENSFDDDLRASTDEEKKRDTAEVIPRVKAAARAMAPADRGVIRGLVVGLLDSYLDYLEAKGDAET